MNEAGERATSEKKSEQYSHVTRKNASEKNMIDATNVRSNVIKDKNAKRK